ncbi:MAG: nucleotidyltransferase [Bacilli bacterium]|nr:nucleotidyltransferase [Bacilli bacterium]
MEVIGVIAEYNPFHNGHKYHLDEIKKRYPKSIIVLALNGYFSERGDISLLTKEDKTKLALDYGVDIVVELPTLFGTQSADIFAEASIKILNNFKVNKIIFGSESNNISILDEIARTQLYDPEFNNRVKEYLSEGVNYPTAMAKALNIEFDFNPNDLLGVSYIKAALKNNFEIEFETIKRTNQYHDIVLDEDIVSASNIREKIEQNLNIEKYVPYNPEDYIVDINPKKFFDLLRYEIITNNHLENYLTVDEGIENKLKKEVLRAFNREDLIYLIKSKRYTYNKISRMFIHILLNVEKKSYTLDYTKVLGFTQNGQKYLSNIRDDLILPINPDINSEMFKYEIKASYIYDLLTNTKTLAFETRNKPIMK